MITSRCILLLALGFSLFSCTRIYRYRHDIARVDALFLSKIRLNHSRFHGDAGASRGNIWQQFREIDFCKAHPCRAAASELRDRTAILKAFHELRCFLHNSQIGTKVRIYYVVRTKFTKGTNHFAFKECARLIAKAFSDSYAHSWRRLDNHNFVWIRNGSFHLIKLGSSMHRIKWTCSRALTAVNTHWHIACGFEVIIVEHAHHVSAGTTAQRTVFTFRDVMSNGRIVECNRHTFIDTFKLGHEDLLVLYNHT